MSRSANILGMLAFRILSSKHGHAKLEAPSDSRTGTRMVSESGACDVRRRWTPGGRAHCTCGVRSVCFSFDEAGRRPVRRSRSSDWSDGAASAHLAEATEPRQWFGIRTVGEWMLAVSVLQMPVSYETVSDSERSHAAESETVRLSMSAMSVISTTCRMNIGKPLNRETWNVGGKSKGCCSDPGEPLLQLGRGTDSNYANRTA